TCLLGAATANCVADRLNTTHAMSRWVSGMVDRTRPFSRSQNWTRARGGLGRPGVGSPEVASSFPSAVNRDSANQLTAPLGRGRTISPDRVSQIRAVASLLSVASLSPEGL